MWKSLGTTMPGLAAGLGAALLNAFQPPVDRRETRDRKLGGSTRAA
jgi:hypothetical protein